MLPSTNGKLDVYGYDPDALYEKYDEAAKAYNENEYGLRNAKDIVKAIEKLADDKG